MNRLFQKSENMNRLFQKAENMNRLFQNTENMNRLFQEFYRIIEDPHGYSGAPATKIAEKTVS